MTITGTIKQILPEQSGVSKAGKSWRRRDQILDITENPQYPKLLCFALMNDRIDAASIAEGQHVTIDCDIDSREYNGRWYTSVTAWKVTPETETAAAAPQQQAQTDNSLPPMQQDFGPIPF
jgi:hypothetical protein|nr:MAG TPA: protein of unknown function DUF3127 [Bacteriophage sp.]